MIDGYDELISDDRYPDRNRVNGLQRRVGKLEQQIALLLSRQNEKTKPNQMESDIEELKREVMALNVNLNKICDILDRFTFMYSCNHDFSGS